MLLLHSDGHGAQPLAQRATHAMLPLQPFDCPEISFVQETEMAQDLADQFSAFVDEHLVDTLADLARDVLNSNNIDPDSCLAHDLVQDLINRIVITAK